MDGSLVLQLLLLTVVIAAISFYSKKVA